MAAPMESMGDTDTVTIINHSGASLVSRKPVFSYDSKCLFCCAGSSIKVLSTVSGECIRLLREHRDTVTGLQINPHNRLQLLSSSLDQTVLQWDYSDGVVLKKFVLHSPIYGILGFADDSIIVLKKAGSRKYDLAEYNLKTGDLEVLIPGVTKDSRQSAVGWQGEYMVAVNKKKLMIYHRKKKEIISHFGEKEFTCVTCHPTDTCLATGSTDGKIHYWWNFSSVKRTVKSVYHWHALPVLDLNFTPEGSYLLSGGHECVLVKWQYNSQRRDFLPRLGAPLSHVTCSSDNQLYATCHHDNSINLITNNFKLQQVYQGLTMGHLQSQVETPAPARMTFDPKTRALVMNGKPGHLQFYSVHSDKQMYNLDIVCENYISPENLNRPTVVTEVTSAAFNYDGTWLSTVEHWDDGVMSPEIRLKFWYFKEESQGFELNTVVERPHEKSVACLKFRPPTQDNDHQQMLVSTGRDGRYKAWVLTDDTDIYKENSKWNCESVGYYRDRPAGQASFAEDGSLLAVTFASSVTLWDPDLNVLRQVFVSNFDQDEMRFVEFGRFSSSHLLVTTTAYRLTVWNLTTCSVSWSVMIRDSVLIADTFSSHMAVVSSDKTLIVFRPDDSTPVYNHSAVSQEAVVCGAFIPRQQRESSTNANKALQWQSQAQLYLFNKKQELLTLEYLFDENKERSENLMKIEQNLPQTPFSLLLSKNRKSDVSGSSTEKTHDQLPASKFTSELMNSAPHVQPPVTSLCKSFIQSLLIRNKAKRKDSSVNSNDKGNESEEDEEDDKINEKSKDSDSEMEVDETLVSVISQSAKKTLTKQTTTVVPQKNVTMDTFKCSVDKQDKHEVTGKVSMALTKEKFDWYANLKT